MEWSGAYIFGITKTWDFLIAQVCQNHRYHPHITEIQLVPKVLLNRPDAGLTYKEGSVETGKRRVILIAESILKSY